MERPKHVFVVDYPTYVAAAHDFDAVMSTVADLNEMGLYRLPYPHDTYVKLTGEPSTPAGAYILFGPLGELCNVFYVDGKSGRKVNIGTAPVAVQECAEMTTAYVQDTLIALLATRNVEKTTRENKLRKLGIGKGMKFDYTTTLRLPKDLPDDADHPPISGGSKVPHMRRGHIRRQHFGQRNESVRRVWIKPVFVNADPAFIPTRKEYRLAG